MSSSDGLENTVLGAILLSFCENLGWTFQKHDHNRQIIFMILSYEDLVQFKKKH